MISGPVNACACSVIVSGEMSSGPVAFMNLATVRISDHDRAANGFPADAGSSPWAADVSRYTAESGADVSPGSDWAMPYVHCGRSPPSASATTGERHNGLETTG